MGLPSRLRNSFKIFAKSYELDLYGKFTFKERHKAEELTFYYVYFSLCSGRNLPFVFVVFDR